MPWMKRKHDAFALLVAQLGDGPHQPLRLQGGEHRRLGARRGIGSDDRALDGLGGRGLEPMPGRLHVVEHDVAGDGHEPGPDVAALVADRRDAAQRTQERLAGEVLGEGAVVHAEVDEPEDVSK